MAFLDAKHSIRCSDCELLVGTEDGDVQCCKRCRAYMSNLSADMTS